MSHNNGENAPRRFHGNALHKQFVLPAHLRKGVKVSGARCPGRDIQSPESLCSPILPGLGSVCVFSAVDVAGSHSFGVMTGAQDLAGCCRAGREGLTLESAGGVVSGRARGCLSSSRCILCDERRIFSALLCSRTFWFSQPGSGQALYTWRVIVDV